MRRDEKPVSSHAPERGDEQSTRDVDPRPWRRGRLALSGLSLLVALGLVAAAQIVLAYRTAIAAHSRAEAGFHELEDADVGTARAELRQATAGFERTAQLLTTPPASLAGRLPLVGDDLCATTALARAAAISGRGVDRLAAAVQQLPGGIDALTASGGALPVEALSTVAPALTTLRTDLDRAVSAVEEVVPGGLLEPVASARDQLLREVERAQATVAVAEPLVRVAPALLGAERPQRYFFAAGSPVELRGRTGFIGAWSILTVDRGRLSFAPFSSIHDLQDLPADAVTAPHPDFLRRYGDRATPGTWRHLAQNPDFPTTAQALEQLWAATHDGDRLDGTIAADPHVFAALLDVLGATEVPGGAVVDADSIVRYVAHDAYGVFDASDGTPDRFSRDRRKQALGEVAAAVSDRFVEEGLADDAGAVAGALRALAGALDDGHVLVHAARDEAQRALEAAGVAGALRDPPGDYLAVYLDSRSNSKVDYYLERALEYRVALLPGGGARSEATVSLHNTAPTTGAPTYVIGPNPGVDWLDAGDSELLINAYLDGTARLRGVTVDGAGTEGLVTEEFGHSVVVTNETLGSGTRRRVAYRVENDEAWRPGDGEGLYRLTVQEQATIRPTEVTIDVTTPPGTVVTDVDERLEVVGPDHVRYTGLVRDVLELEVRFRRQAPEG